METIDYLKPVSFLKHSNNVSNLECLLLNDYYVNFISPNRYCEVKGKGYIVLDFGKEYFGGIRISLGNNNYEKDSPFLRIRFGESLMEANSDIGYNGSCNDHSTRDMVVYMSPHSDMMWGSTGFRFVRIDFIEDATYQIENIFLAFRHEEEPELKFKSSSERLNKIMDAAIRTLWMNKHNGVFFEGAKRDQHVWAGDLYPELTAALYSFSSHENVKNSINFIIDNYPSPIWYNGIPSYNAWLVLTILRYFALTGDIDETYLKCISDNILLFKKYIENDFQLEEELWGLTFLDWSTWNQDSRLIGIKHLFIYTLQQLISSEYIDSRNKEIASDLLSRIELNKSDATDSKAVNSLILLSEKGDKESLIRQIKENGCHGYTSFLSYFILESLARNNELQFAYDSMLSYFGGMIDVGGTTLFEEFDISWLENSCKLDELASSGQHDFHGDFGKECYTGYRKSLCHGWACGVIPFVIENIIGFHIKNGKEVTLIPNLLGLDFIECIIPTKKGNIQININKDKYDIKLPKELVLKRRNYEK